MRQILIILVMALAMPAVAAAQGKTIRCMEFFTDAYKKRKDVSMTIIRSDNSMFKKIDVEENGSLCDQIEKAVSEDMKNADDNGSIVEKYYDGEVKMIFVVNGWNIIFTREDNDASLSLNRVY